MLSPDWPAHLHTTQCCFNAYTCTYINYDWQIIRTVFFDGYHQELWNMGINPENAKKWANDLGFSNPWEHFISHELLHTWLAIKMGFRFSPTLWTVAHDKIAIWGKVTRKSQGLEEWLVTEFEKYIKTCRREEYPIKWLEDLGHSGFDLRNEAIKFLQPYVECLNGS